MRFDMGRVCVTTLFDTSHWHYRNFALLFASWDMEMHKGFYANRL